MITSSYSFCIFMCDWDQNRSYDWYFPMGTTKKMSFSGTCFIRRNWQNRITSAQQRLYDPPVSVASWILFLSAGYPIDKYLCCNAPHCINTVLNIINTGVSNLRAMSPSPYQTWVHSFEPYQRWQTVLRKYDRSFQKLTMIVLWLLSSFNPQ